MKIDKNTKIATLINENSEAIEAIASINKHFRKLKNPILRKVLAKRVTIEDAAKIGNVSVSAFMEKLQSIGFEIEESKSKEPQTIDQSDKKDVMQNNKFDLTNVLTLDVRPDIQGGVDPFKRIMKTIKTIPEGQVLKIVNTFEPIPLINLLKSKGFQSYVERPEAGIVHAFFKKVKGSVSEMESPKVGKVGKTDFEEIVQSFGEKIKTIDVRSLPMPEPMVTILSELEQLPDDHALYVHHKKFPQFLIPELKKRGYDLVAMEIDENQLELIIWKV
ncbi:MAG: DUF2249 domain-containing protein [Bacteroidetes bacterium]|nr:DUF2249 domain-containing protein [Bacteroidota bacterium]